MSSTPTSPIAAAGLIGGYATARFSGSRPLGGAVLLAAGAWCARAWMRAAGPRATAVLLGIYGAGFGASHPLAKRIGAWRSVLLVSAISAGACHVLADRRPEAARQSSG